MVTFLVEQKTKVQSPQALQTPQASIPTPAQLAERYCCFYSRKKKWEIRNVI